MHLRVYLMDDKGRYESPFIHGSLYSALKRVQDEKNTHHEIRVCDVDDRLNFLMIKGNWEFPKMDVMGPVMEVVDFLTLLFECKKEVGELKLGRRGEYSGNEDHGSFENECGNDVDIPQPLNEKLNKLASMACEVFITGDFKINIPSLELANKAACETGHEIVAVKVGERDSFGPVTYFMRCDEFDILIA